MHSTPRRRGPRPGLTDRRLITQCSVGPLAGELQDRAGPSAMAHQHLPDALAQWKYKRQRSPAVIEPYVTDATYSADLSSQVRTTKPYRERSHVSTTAGWQASGRPASPPSAHLSGSWQLASNSRRVNGQAQMTAFLLVRLEAPGDLLQDLLFAVPGLLREQDEQGVSNVR